MDEDVRWIQRFSNFRKALTQLNTVIKIHNKSCNFDIYEDDIDDIIKESVVKRFEYTHELSWKVMKDFANYQGSNNISGSRDATREAFKIGLIKNNEDAVKWMEMIKSRNLSIHTYDDKTAENIAKKIISDYHKLFLDFEQTMIVKIDGEQKEIF